MTKAVTFTVADESGGIVITIDVPVMAGKLRSFRVRVTDNAARELVTKVGEILASRAKGQIL